MSKVTSWEVAELGSDPPPGFGVGSGFVSASLSCHPGGACPPCRVNIIIPISCGRKRSPWRSEPVPRRGPGYTQELPALFASLGAGGLPISSHRYEAGSDGPISGHWPTAVVATPYQTPSRPHLSPSQGSQRGPVGSYLAGAARASSGTPGLHQGPAGLVSPRALPSSDRLGGRVQPVPGQLHLQVLALFAS